MSENLKTNEEVKARTIPASNFKTHCLGLLDEIVESGEEIVVTKRGKPVARVTPVEDEDQSLLGSVTFLVSDEEFIKPIDVPWNAVIE